MITVTKPFIPPLADYQQWLESIWARGWLTNHGPLVNELEQRLRRYLEVENLLFVSNGTVALQLALRALDVAGEVITTPFSYVATTSSILWERLTPVMVDIRPDTLNINPDLIEAAITERTTAILAVHVYGNPCEIERLQHIAERYRLRLIFDAAHAFGTRYRGRSLYAYGDVATASFHATKLFHTTEGGAVVASDPEIVRRLTLMRNFGHTTPTDFDLVGINGKNSEFHAAMGLSNLPYIQEILDRRAALSERYDDNLAGADVQHQRIEEDCVYNHAYYPVIFRSEDILLKVIEAFQARGIQPRRYFYPSLSSLKFLPRRDYTPVCDSIARRALCLPLYHALSFEEVDMISGILLDSLHCSAG